ncbi:hypothetical protein OH76DRAFT_1365964 [Lentinus brumalis]|uniref:Uncharacterized protein n=1 Tax=Lentinus brumalis TaxID=2498619 RepID=A0A371CK01_9APHY|nr:hypothetical protein OH76DRAFT_1365964 [Polyporus brumalis]
MRVRIHALRKRGDALRKKVQRAPEQQARAISRAVEAATATTPAQNIFCFKEKGVVSDPVRELVRDLIALGVRVRHVNGVISTVAGAAGLTVVGGISERTAARTMGEPWIAHQMQTVELVGESEGMSTITLSGDGTGLKNIQHNARHLVVNKGDVHREHVLGVSTAANHTAETQAAGWKDIASSYYNAYNNSPHGKENPQDSRTFASCISGAMTDHAEDQKKLVRTELFTWKVEEDLQLRGAQVFAEGRMSLADPEFLGILAEETAAAVTRAGGAAAWAVLGEEELEVRDQEVTRAILHRVGAHEFKSLSEEEQRLARLFVHGGCSMHKDLNAAKGAYAGLAAYWKENGLEEPVLLMNRDNGAAAASGNSQARTRAVESSRGGAVKLTELAGALFRHKDDKKGQQDAFRFYFYATTGKLLTFPDTSNTRFGSIGDASTVLIVHHQRVCEFLEQIRDKKETGQWNHLEANVHLGMGNIPTVTELAVLSIYSQTVSHPYMRYVRGPDRPNHLNLGPLHERVKQHVKRVSEDPDLVLGESQVSSDSTLDGNEWDNPEAFHVIRKLIPILPHLRGALAAAFKRAFETWGRFAEEFKPGGVIAQLSDVEKGRAFMASTNDVNEGLLGAARVTLQHNPNMSLVQFNARVTYARNDGRTYIHNLGDKNRKHLRGEWRVVDASGQEKKRKLDIAAAIAKAAADKRAVRAATRAKKTARLREVLETTPIRDPTMIHSRVTNSTLKQQLSWHRTFVDTGPKDEKQIPRVSDLPNKEAMLPALVAAIGRYNDSEILQARAEDNLSRVKKEVEKAMRPQASAGVLGGGLGLDADEEDEDEEDE